MRVGRVFVGEVDAVVGDRLVVVRFVVVFRSLEFGRFYYEVVLVVRVFRLAFDYVVVVL